MREGKEELAKIGAKDMRYGNVREGDSTFLMTATTQMKPSEAYPLGISRPPEWISTSSLGCEDGGEIKGT